MKKYEKLRYKGNLYWKVENPEKDMEYFQIQERINGNLIVYIFPNESQLKEWIDKGFI